MCVRVCACGVPRVPGPHLCVVSDWSPVGGALSEPEVLVLPEPLLQDEAPVFETRPADVLTHGEPTCREHDAVQLPLDLPTLGRRD